ncbi:hypothetical protein Tco_1268919 [Tanacetum coccineum]
MTGSVQRVTFSNIQVSNIESYKSDRGNMTDNRHQAIDCQGVRMTKIIKGEFEKIKDVKVEDVQLTCNAPLKIRGDDEVELTDEESSDDEDDTAEVFRIDTNIFDYETPLWFKTYEDYKNDWIYEWNKDVPWVGEKPWTDAGVWTKPTPLKHTWKPFNYITGCSKWPTYSWKDDGYYSKLKDLALRNKAIMEGLINEDDDESRYEQKRRWNIYTNYDDAYEINLRDNEKEELCEIHELLVCNIRRYMMIKYSFNNDEEYVAVKENEYDDLTITRKEAYRAYQEIFV